MKRKVLIDFGVSGYWKVEDVTDYYNEVKEDIGEEKANLYFRAGTFNGEEIENTNGEHFIYGFLESLQQSDNCPTDLYNETIQKITIEVVEEKSTLVKCKNCKHCGFDLEDFFNPTYKCNKEKRNLKEVDSIDSVEVECDSYKHKYIEYPLTIEGIDKPDNKGIQPYFGNEIGTLVKIRPCADKYENKTYLGLLLGEIDIGLMIGHYESTNRLEIYRHYNPAIFVPKLKEIIYGCESWWSIIKSEEELKEITNEDIDKVWYVQLLKDLSQNKNGIEMEKTT